MNAQWTVLADARYVNLATFRRNGAEIRTPVWIADRAVVATAYGALNAKYGWQMRIGDFFSKLTGKFDRRAMIEITVAD